MLSRRIPTPYAKELDHLVIELKAPKKALAAEDTQQIKSYAYAVSRDERFKGLRTKWRFWLVGNDLSEFVERELDNDLPTGVLQQTTDDITISVRRWSELIQEARSRLEFVQKELDYEVNRDEALEKFRTTSSAHILGESVPAESERNDQTTDDEDQDGDEVDELNSVTELPGSRAHPS